MNIEDKMASLVSVSSSSSAMLRGSLLRADQSNIDRRALVAVRRVPSVVVNVEEHRS